MKNIMLQHWTGPLNEITKLSTNNISNYAASLGSDYRLLRGDVFRKGLEPNHTPLQKLYMLDKEFDEYDFVVMLDSDMFIRKGMNENIFTDLTGVGLFTEVQERLVNSTHAKNPHVANPKYPWWGGAIYRLDRDLRQKLRVNINKVDLSYFCSRRTHGDEGVMHYLAMLANITEKSYFPDNRWCYCSFLNDIGNAAIVHIRTKISPNGPKKTKLENYKKLVEKGLI